MINEEAGWDDVYTWLTGKPDEWGQVIALRSALRVLPLVIDPPKWRDNKVDPAFVLPLFRYLVISSSTIQHSADTTLKIALFDEARRFQKAYSRFNEHEFAPENVEFAAGDIVASAADAALSTAHAFQKLGGRGQNEYAEASFARSMADGPRFAARAAEYVDKASSDIWSFVDQERAVLEDKVHPAKIANGKIWEATPEWFRESWGRGTKWLSRPEDGFAIWREWYYGRLEGLPHAFADFDDEADETFYRWIIEQDDDWWSRAPAEVNADIKALVDRLRKPEPPSDAELEQNSKALTFIGNDRDQISLSGETSGNKVLEDAEARDRHKLVLSSAKAALEVSASNRTQAVDVAPRLEAYLNAIGVAPDQVKASQLIVFGSNLRAMINRRADSSLAPFSEDQETALQEWRQVHNMFVGLDPYLSSIERAGRDPEAPMITIELDAVKAAIDDGANQQALDDGAVAAMTASAEAVDQAAGPDDPRQVRLVESLKNSIRAAAAIIKRNPIKSVGAVGGGAYWVASWAQRHSEWLRQLFAEEPSMLEIIAWIGSIPL